MSDTKNDTTLMRHALHEVSFGEWLKRRRKVLGLTQEQFAQQLNCSTITLRKIEAEERRPSSQMVDLLAQVLNILPNERAEFLKFARGNWKSAPGEITEDVPWRVSTLRSNLPTSLTSLIGREQDVVVICEYLSNAGIRLVTLIGPPGIGKTRLSIESARAVLQDFPDGVFFVALAPLEEPGLIEPTITQTLGFVEIKSQSSLERLKDGIGGKQMLLILDNAEHLIEGVATLVSDLLSICPRLKILTTSREALRVSGEWLYSVPFLSVPKDILSTDAEVESQFSALTLFAERARAVRADFTLNTDNLQLVASICAQLDGLPLAIELIAARMRLMSPRALLERLNDQFTLSADGMRAASARQQTLDDAIGWSYNLLSAEEQKLFVYLSVFSGGFTLEAAESIFWGMFTARSVSNLVTSLLDKSLLQRTFDARGEARFDMLVTIQQFALDHLRRMGSEAEVRNWHLVYFLALAEEGDKEMRGPNQIEWLHRLHVMRDNFRAALQWVIETGQTEAALQMARKLHWFFFVRGDHNEGRQWLGRVLALPDTPLYPEMHSEILTQLAHHTWLEIGAEQAQPFVESALSLARAHAHKHNTAKALAILGLIMIYENNFAVASSCLEESKVLFQEVNDQWGFAHAVMCLGTQSQIQQDWATSLILYKRVLKLFRDLGDGFFQGVALRFIGDLQMKQGNLASGVVALRQALLLAQQLDSKYEIGQTLWRCAEAAQRSEKPAYAVCLYWATKKVLDSIGAWTEGDELILENDLAPCRAALDEEEFEEAVEQAVEQGRAMTMEQAIAYALETSND